MVMRSMVYRGFIVEFSVDGESVYQSKIYKAKENTLNIPEGGMGLEKDGEPIIVSLYDCKQESAITRRAIQQIDQLIQSTNKRKREMELKSVIAMLVGDIKCDTREWILDNFAEACGDDIEKEIRKFLKDINENKEVDKNNLSCEDIYIESDDFLDSLLEVVETGVLNVIKTYDPQNIIDRIEEQIDEQ